MTKAGRVVVFVLLAACAQVALAQPDPGQAQKERERLKAAEAFFRKNQPDLAAKKLKETVDDNNASNASKRTALSMTAWYYWKCGNIDKGVEYYREVLKRPEVGDWESVEDLARLAHLAPTEELAVAFDKFIDAHPNTAPANVARAHYEKGRTHVSLKNAKEATAAFDSVLAVKNAPFKWIREATLGQGDAAVVQDDKAKAIAIHQAFLRRPWSEDFPYDSVDRLVDIERLIAIAPGLDVTPEVATCLNDVWFIRDVQLSSVAPKYDVLYAIQNGRVKQGDDLLKGTVRYKLFREEAHNPATPKELADVNAQLWKGGDLRPFATSDLSKKLAKRISSDAPRGDFLKLFLAGKHREAAQIAWRHARLEKDRSEHEVWLNAVLLAVGCDFQTRGGRRIAFQKWARPELPIDKAFGDVKPDALEDYLGSFESAYEPTQDEWASAAAHLNTVKVILKIDLHVVRAVLPDNDVALVGIEPNRAAEAYAAYLWRTTGRADDEVLASVQHQLDQGGKERPFKVTAIAIKLAGMISNEAPLGEYLKLLLTGDHRQAARLAWKNALAAKASNDKSATAEFENWRNAVVVAVRCRDQVKEGRAQQLLDWSKTMVIGPDGKPVPPNPLADFPKD